MSAKKAENEVEKLVRHTDEWNHIYPFMEWLQEQGIHLYRNRTEEEKQALEESGYGWGKDDHIGVSKSIEQLLYEYFGVDPKKLEAERRAILDQLRKETGIKQPAYRKCRVCGRHYETLDEAILCEHDHEPEGFERARIMEHD